MEENLGFQINWASLIVGSESNLKKKTGSQGCYIGGRRNKRVFGIIAFGGGGLYFEGLIHIWRSLF